MGGLLDSGCVQMVRVGHDSWMRGDWERCCRCIFVVNDLRVRIKCWECSFGWKRGYGILTWFVAVWLRCSGLQVASANEIIYCTVYCSTCYSSCEILHRMWAARAAATLNTMQSKDVVFACVLAVWYRRVERNKLWLALVAIAQKAIALAKESETKCLETWTNVSFLAENTRASHTPM